MKDATWPRYVVGVLLGLAIAWGFASHNSAPGQSGRDLPTVYHYKTVGFRVDYDKNPALLQEPFTNAINAESATGWEYVGRCARYEGKDYSVDYVVFRKKRI